MKNKLFLGFLFTISTLYCFGQCIDVDTTFGNYGFISNGPGISPSPISGTELVIQNDKFLTFSSNLKRFNNNGSLDVSFGVNGTYTYPADFYFRKLVVIGSDYYLIGSSYAGSAGFYNIKIVKVDSNGNMVNIFGPFNYGENEEGIDLVQTSDNKLMVMCQKYDSLNSSGWVKLFLLKLNLNGTIDTSFQNNGTKEMYVFPQRTIPYKIYNYAGNKLLIVCSGNVGSNFKMGLVKMDENGNLDTTFNATGIAFLDNGSQERLNEVQLKENVLYTRLDDGTNINNRIVLYDMDSLNILRTMSLNYYVNYYGQKFIVNDDNSMIITSISDVCNPCNKNAIIHKYLPDGTVDTSFCSGGSQELNISNVNNYYVDDQSAYIYKMGTDKILISGAFSIPYTGPQHASWLRLVPGNLSTTNFEKNKTIISPNPVNDNLNFQLNNNVIGNAVLKIYNSLGQLIKEDVVYMNSNSVTISVADLATDFYLIKIQDAQGNNYNSKFLKK